jgi:DNA-binding response OmpR family regulator
MSGFELTKNLKDNPQYRDIPIIMFSALDDVKDKLTGFELGVDDYITPPFNFSEVLARIKAALRNRELITQIIMRESRLDLAETLSHDMKQDLADFTKDIDDLDSAVTALSAGEPLDQETLAKLPGAVREETGKLRKRIAELDARIEKTFLEWETLKKDEIGLPALESQIRKLIQQG